MAVDSTYYMVLLAPTVRYVVGGSNLCDCYTNHTALRCGTPHSATPHCSAMPRTYVQTEEWVTTVRSIHMSVYLMLWALHVPCWTWYMCVVFYTDERHSHNPSVSEPHSGNVNVSEPHSVNVNMSEPQW